MITPIEDPSQEYFSPVVTAHSVSPESGSAAHTAADSSGSTNLPEVTTTKTSLPKSTSSTTQNQININTMMKGPIPLFPFSDAYVPQPDDGKRHPRELVPSEVGFPTPETQHIVQKQDAEDRLLMATCAVLHSHENRALCPKEIAEVMFQRNWLHNA
jgi:hypothetical protein